MLHCPKAKFQFFHSIQKEVEPLHISYTILVRGDVVFRFLAIGLNHFPSLWCGGRFTPPPLHFPENSIFYFWTLVCLG